MTDIQDQSNDLIKDATYDINLRLLTQSKASSSASQTSLSIDSETPSNSDIQTYMYRFVLLFCFVPAGFANAFLLLTFSPISDKANEYWDEVGATAINLFAVSFQIFYIPGTILGIYVSKYYSLKNVMILGGMLTSFGCLIRWLGAYIYEEDRDNMSSEASYTIVLIGTILASLAQPFYLNLPAKIAAAWFPVKERDLATTICFLSHPLGSSLGSLVPPLFVSGSDSSVSGIPKLLLMQMLIAISSLILTIAVFRSAPPTPPSVTESEKIRANQSTTDGLVVQNESFMVVMHREGSRLMGNVEYLKLLVSFTIALGSLNALAALVNQLPGDYSNRDVGTVAFALIMSGCVGTFIVGFLLDRLQAYRTILKIMYSCAWCAWIIFILSCRSNNYGYFVSTAVILGLCFLPIVPSTYMNAVECSYPIPEDVTLGLLNVAANTFSIPLTLLGQMILESPDNSVGASPMYPYVIWSVGLLSVSLANILFFNGTYVRLGLDSAKGKASSQTDHPSVFHTPAIGLA